MAARVLALVIAGAVLTMTGCIDGEEAESGVVMVGAVGADPIEGSCRQGRLTIQPLDADSLTVALEQGRPVVAGTCNYGFEAEVPDAERYTFTSPDWPSVTLSDNEIERAEVEGHTVLRVRLDFRR